MEISSQVKSLTFKSLILAIIFIVFLWLSIFLYSLVYYLYIPSVAHVKPVHFRYDTLCNKGSNCFFPYDNITLSESNQNQILTSGQSYAVELVLIMPESERNLNQGMFMIHLDMLSSNGEVLQTSRRPAMLHYRSPLFKSIYTLFYVPGLLLGSVEEKQSLNVPLFEKYVEDSYKPTHFAFLVLEAESPELYSSSLKIHAQFTGLRYMMYYWPILSAVVGIGCSFTFCSVVAIIIWIRQIVNTPQRIDMNNLSEQEQGVVREIRESIHKSRIQTIRSESPGSSSRQKNDSDTDEESIEDVSPYRRVRSSSKYGPRSPGQSSPSRTIPHTSSESEEFSEAFENIAVGGRSASPTHTSPAVRRRTVAIEDS